MARKRWPRGTWMKLTGKAILRALIEQRGLSYGDLGSLANCHRSMISALVNGHRTSCTPELAERIAMSLNVPLEVLFVPKLSAPSSRNDHSQRKAS